MSAPLIIMVFLTFTLTITLVVLRFSAILSSMIRQAGVDRREYAREVDMYHLQAHERAMEALQRISEKSHQEQIEMFNRTMDMVHGPQGGNGDQQGVEYAVDDLKLAHVPGWAIGVDGEEDRDLLYSDPLDDSMPPEQGPNPEVMGTLGGEPHAVSVRPGEGLLG